MSDHRPIDSLPERPYAGSQGSPSSSTRDSHRERGADYDSRRRHADDDLDGSSSSRRDRGDRSERDSGRSRDEPDRDYADRDSERHHRPRSRRDDDDEYREVKRRRSRERPDEDDYARRGGGGRRYRDDRDYGYDRGGPSRRYRDSPGYDRSPRDRDYRERRPREPTPPREPDLTEEEREMRSVFVSQLSARVTDRELGIFFEHGAGKVRDARVIVDRISRRSKGVGYVEFVELESVNKALSMSGTKLLGIPIIVQFTEAEKNRQAMNASGPVMTGDDDAFRLYVGSLNFALTENDIRQVFQPFGAIEMVDLHKDPVSGKSKGYAFVQFKEGRDAMQALEKMNNFPLAGREIRVGLVSDKSQNPEFRKAVMLQQQMLANPGQQPQAPETSLAIDDGTGGTLRNISRIELMQKLARTEVPHPDLPNPATFRPHIPVATTRNVMMSNAFDPQEETERDWDLELRDDVKGEVEDKYGKVAEIFVVKESQGEIFIRFEGVPAAVNAVAGLNGRWFGGRQIQASHTPDSLFDAKKA